MVNRISKKNGSMPAMKFGNGKIKEKTSPMKKKSPLNISSVSRKVIGEFRKSALQKYQLPPPSSSCSPKSSAREWQVLYTTQITQKSKKYHDGVLRLIISGLQGRQVMLYDTSRKLLDSKFLKTDEIIESGQSLRLDVHLVDIGDPAQNQESPVNLNVQPSNSNKAGQTEMLHGQHTIFKAVAGTAHAIPEVPHCASASNEQTGVGESFEPMSSTSWQVLYTTQITQKSKKYNDGILLLRPSGLRGRQVMLYDTSEKLLDRKFLKKDEIIESGQKLRLDAYLVDIGEREQNQESPADFSVQPSNCNKVGQAEMLHDECTIKCNKTVTAAKRQLDAPSSKGAALSFSSLNADDIKLRNKPFRDTHQILSGLKKPMTVSIDTCDAKAKMEQSWASPCLDIVQCDLQDLVQGQLDQDPQTTGRSTLENSKVSSYTVRKDSQPTFISQPYDRLSKNTDARESIELTSSSSAQMGGQFSKGIKIGNLVQSYAGTEVNYRSCEGASCGVSSLSADASLGSGVMETKCFEEHKNTKNLDDCPSFDLMF